MYGKETVIFVTLVTIFLTLTCLSSVQGHGRFKEPPSRSSMWRFGFNTPINYRDNELFCGGSSYQKKKNGRCGVCGDPVEGPFENEDGGKYATGTIARTYRQGALILAEAELTAHHKGFFEFRLCNQDEEPFKLTKECLDKHLLKYRDGSTKYFPTEGTKVYKLYLQLPAGLTCNHCVIQWRYHTGNSWGCEGEEGVDRRCAIGLGHQEEFYGCADVAINTQGSSGSNQNYAPSGNNQLQPPVQQLTPPPTPSPTTPTAPAPNPSSNNQGQGQNSANQGQGQNSNNQGQGQNAGNQNNGMSASASGMSCQATDSYSGSLKPAFDTWCQDNCVRGNCPKTICKCTGKKKICKARNPNSLLASQYSSYCAQQMTVGICPRTHCVLVDG